MSEAFARGGCFCGAVRYALSSAPMFVQACHCRDCQRQTGGPYAINALIERERVLIERGSPAATEMPTDSGRPHDIWRCPDCNTALWSDYGRRRSLLFVRVATLDEPAKAPPDVHIFTANRLAWDELPAGARAFPVYYDMQREWPAESLARRRALLGEA